MQKKINFRKIFSLCLCVLLVAAMAIFTTACTKGNNTTDGNAVTENMGTYGQGEKTFTFVVSDKQGKEFYYDIATNKATVGEALIELGLIQGEEGPYGLYVKTVNGITLDYDKDGMYWAFYVNAELSPKGVDQTEITNGETYRFVAAEG